MSRRMMINNVLIKQLTLGCFGVVSGSTPNLPNESVPVIKVDNEIHKSMLPQKYTPPQKFFFRLSWRQIFANFRSQWWTVGSAAAVSAIFAYFKASSIAWVANGLVDVVIVGYFVLILIAFFSIRVIFTLSASNWSCLMSNQLIRAGPFD